MEKTVLSLAQGWQFHQQLNIKLLLFYILHAFCKPKCGGLMTFDQCTSGGKIRLGTKCKSLEYTVQFVYIELIFASQFIKKLNKKFSIFIIIYQV